jgi:hypothetical protein
MDEESKTEELEPGTAETPASPSTPVTTDGAAAELTVAEAQEWKGHKLDDLGGSTVGKVEGVYVDAESGRPEWLLARMGRFGNHCLVPARDAVAAAGHVWVPYGRDKVRKAPRQAPDTPLEREAEQALLDYYGVGTGEVGRGSDLAERDEGGVTSRPA